MITKRETEWMMQIQLQTTDPQKKCLFAIIFRFFIAFFLSWWWGKRVFFMAIWVTKNRELLVCISGWWGSIIGWDLNHCIIGLFGLPGYLPLLSCVLFTVSDKHTFFHGISLVSSIFPSLGFAALMCFAVNFSCFMIVLSEMLSKNQESNKKNKNT